MSTACCAEFDAKLPKGSFIETRGQVATMRSSFVGLGVGLVFAIVLVYFVMVVNFQSWLDPFIILMALPGALSGIVLMLFVTQTTLNVPSLMGAIMSIGVATANSILLVNFANDLRETGVGLRFRRARSRLHAPAAGADDGAGHDRRHAAHGAGLRRGRRAERPAGPRRDRRPAAGHGRYAVLCAGGLQRAPAHPAALRKESGDRHMIAQPTGVQAGPTFEAAARPAGSLFRCAGAASWPRPCRRPPAAALAPEGPARRFRKPWPSTGRWSSSRRRTWPPSKDAIDLPGDLQAMIESPIFARADGYLKTRLVDIGDHVKTGQPMAEIETPELDQQIAQARATLAQSQSSLKELQADIAAVAAPISNCPASPGSAGRVCWRRAWSRARTPTRKQADLAVKAGQTEKAEAALATAQDTIHASQAKPRAAWKK